MLHDDAFERPVAVEIKVRDDGPYKVTGPIRLVDAEGGVLDVPAGAAVVLCRCGRSEDKPFCDGSHKGLFSSRVRARVGERA